MAVRGAGANTEILIGSYSRTNVVLFTTPDGLALRRTSSPSRAPARRASVAWALPSARATPSGPRADITTTCARLPLTRVLDRDRVAVFHAGTQVPNDLTGLGVDAAANILGGVCFNDFPNHLQLYLISGNAIHQACLIRPSSPPTMPTARRMPRPRSRRVGLLPECQQRAGRPGLWRAGRPAGDHHQRHQLDQEPGSLSPGVTVSTATITRSFTRTPSPTAPGCRSARRSIRGGPTASFTDTSALQKHAIIAFKPNSPGV